MERPPFNAEASSRTEFLMSRSAEFIEMENRALKGGNAATTPDERKLLKQYMEVEKRFANIVAEREAREALESLESL